MRKEFVKSIYVYVYKIKKKGDKIIATRAKSMRQTQWVWYFLNFFFIIVETPFLECFVGSLTGWWSRARGAWAHWRLSDLPGPPDPSAIPATTLYTESRCFPLSLSYSVQVNIAFVCLPATEIYLYVYKMYISISKEKKEEGEKKSSQLAKRSGGNAKCQVWDNVLNVEVHE